MFIVQCFQISVSRFPDKSKLLPVSLGHHALAGCTQKISLVLSTDVLPSFSVKFDSGIHLTHRMSISNGTSTVQSSLFLCPSDSLTDKSTQIDPFIQLSLTQNFIQQCPSALPYLMVSVLVPSIQAFHNFQVSSVSILLSYVVLIVWKFTQISSSQFKTFPHKIAHC